MAENPTPHKRPSVRCAAALILAALVLIGHGSLTVGEEDGRRRSNRRARLRPPPVTTTNARAQPEAVRLDAPTGGESTPDESVPATDTPAAPETVAVEEPLEPVLTRIVLVPGDPDSSFAVVGGRAVRAGDSLDGAKTVRAILADRVLLSPEGELRFAPDRKGETR